MIFIKSIPFTCKKTNSVLLRSELKMAIKMNNSYDLIRHLGLMGGLGSSQHQRSPTKLKTHQVIKKDISLQNYNGLDLYS